MVMFKERFVVPCQVYQVNGSPMYFIYLDNSEMFARQQEMTLEYETPPTQTYQTLVSQETYDKLLKDGYLKVSIKPEVL
jgi:hypothetical protein